MAAQYWTSKHGTKIDISGLDAATLKKVKDLANQKYGTKATEIANSYRKANPPKAATTTTNTTTNNTANTDTTANTTTNTNTNTNTNTGTGEVGKEQVPAKLEPTDAEIIARAKGIIGEGEAFGRRLGNEFYADGALGRQKEELSPDEVQALAKLQALTGTAGQQSDFVRNLLAQQQGILTDAQQLSALEQEALNVSRNALQGLRAPELEAMRSAARENILGQAQAEARAMAKAQARNMVTGAAATAQRRLLGQDQIRETRNLERDLLIKDVDIKAAARNAFTNLATQTEANRAGRTNAASGQLAQTGLTDEANRRSAEATATANYASGASNAGDRLRQLQQYNLDQAAAERAGRIGSIFTGVGTITGQRGLLAGEDFANKEWLESQAVRDQIFDIVRQSLKQQKGTL